MKKYLWHNLCPEVSADDPYYEAINDYDNQEFRQSFSIEMWKCTSAYGGTCKNDVEIEEFLKEIYFDMYVTGDDVLFSESGQVELISKNHFFIQFQGDINKYKDNNNQLVKNTVISRSERLKVWNEPQKIEYLHFNIGPNWDGHKAFK